VAEAAWLMQLGRTGTQYSSSPRKRVAKERRVMAQIVTLVSLAAAAAGFLLFHIWKSHFPQQDLKVSIRLDRVASGAHVIWDVVNVGPTPITLTKLVVHPPLGRNRKPETVPFASPKRLAPLDEMVIATDVEWNVLTARSLALVDEHDHEYPAPHLQLETAQDQLHRVVDRRVYTASAREFLFGAGDFAFGVVILGLGFFMLMWVIATG
jgi:hypothetical protein